MLTVIIVIAVFRELSAVFGQIPEPTPPECYNETVSEHDVANLIFQKYRSPFERPRLNAMKTIGVNITLCISSINDVLEKERVIRVTAYLALRWFDEFHVWNETFPQRCIPYLATELWRPDVAQINDRAGRYTLMEMSGEKIRLHSNGWTTFSPGGTFDAFCDFDFRLFPFDSQKCSIQLESWRYTSGYVSFHLFPTKIYQWWENDQWTLVRTGERLIAETYTFAEMKFDRVEFYVFLKRKSMYYLLNIVMPSIIISLAQLSIFTLPLGDSSKLDISFTCLLAYSVFQLMISNDMPRSSDRVPLLSSYIGLKMFNIALCMLGEGIVFLLLEHVENDRQEVPHLWYRLAVTIGKVIRVKQNLQEGDESSENARDEIRLATTVNSQLSGCDLTKEQYRSSESIYYDTLSNADLERSGWSLNREKKYDNGEITRRMRWTYVAKVAERITCCFYLSGIVIAPLVLMLIAAIVQWRN